MADRELAYDYKNQTWLRRKQMDSDGICTWRVQECDHPADARPDCCFAGAHAGEVIVHHSEIH